MSQAPTTGTRRTPSKITSNNPFLQQDKAAQEEKEKLRSRYFGGKSTGSTSSENSGSLVSPRSEDTAVGNGVKDRNPEPVIEKKSRSKNWRG